MDFFFRWGLFVSWHRVLFCKLFALELTKILLSRPPKHWDYRHETPCPASIFYFMCSSVLSAYHTMCMSGACRDQKRASDARNWNYGRWWDTMWILGIGHRSSGQHVLPLQQPYGLLTEWLRASRLGNDYIVATFLLCCSYCNKIKHKTTKSKLMISSSSCTLRTSVPGRH